MKKLNHCILYILLISFGAGCAFAGSYALAESYCLNISPKRLIEQIEEWKVTHLEYQVKTVGYIEHNIGETIISDTPSDNPQFYSCTFYLPDIYARVHCVVRCNNENLNADFSVILFVSVLYSSDTMFRWINTKDLTRKENKAIKKKFEEEILNQLGVEWKKC